MLGNLHLFMTKSAKYFYGLSWEHYVATGNMHLFYTILFSDCVADYSSFESAS